MSSSNPGLSSEIAVNSTLLFAFVGAHRSVQIQQLGRDQFSDRSPKISHIQENLQVWKSVLSAFSTSM